MTSFAATHAPRFNYPKNQFLYWLLLFPVFLALTLLIHIKSLRSNLIFDDVAVPLYFTNPNFGWVDCVLPLGNGFIRAIMMLHFKLLYETVNVAPFWYHLSAAGLHAAVAATAGVAFCILVGVSRPVGALVGLSVTFASAAFPVVFMLSNAGDSLIALAALLLISWWAMWLHTGQIKYLWLLALSVLVAFGGKESGVTIGGIIVLQTWIMRPVRPKAWLITSIVFSVCVVYGLVITKIQDSNEASYANAGWVSHDPIEISRRIVGYLTAVFFPGSFIMDPLFPSTKLSTAFVFALRSLSGFCLLASVWVVVRRRARPVILRAAMFYCAAAGMLLPTSMLNMSAGPFSPTGRFLYSAIPLSMLALGCLVVAWWPARRAMQYLMFSVWFVWLVMQVWVVRKSPGTLAYYETAREWKNFIGEMERLSPEWPPMQAVTVYTGPPHGSRTLDEGYGLAIFRVYFPTLLANYYSNRTIPETTRAYVFDGKKMTPAPILPPGQ